MLLECPRIPGIHEVLLDDRLCAIDANGAVVNPLDQHDGHVAFVRLHEDEVADFGGREASEILEWQLLGTARQRLCIV